MDTIDINGRRVGPGHPCFVIAEAGVNHNGDWRLACELVDAAFEAGADAVKFQTWITDQLVLPGAATAEYQRDNLGSDPGQYEMLKALELSHAQFRRIQAHARRRGILFLSTPDEEASADFLEKLGVPLFKIGSGEVTNLSFLRHVARKGRPVMLSTGMSTLGEVEAAVGALHAARGAGIALLHCVSSYPAAPAECNLSAMATLRAAFGLPVGWSDHTPGHDIASAAVALGACIVEKHLTLDTTMAGPDHRASLGPAQFKALVQAVRDVESALGSGCKTPTAAEAETKRVVQKSVVVSRALRAGARLTPGILALRRASGGMPASAMASLAGRRAARDLPAWTVIAPEDLQ